MKLLIKKLLREHLLFESVSDITYHFNHTGRTIQILETNKINLSAAFGTKSDKILNKNKLFFLSTTSSRSSDIGYAASLSKDDLVRLTLDGRALNQNYEMTRIDYWQRSKDPKDPMYNPHGDATGKSFYKNISRQDELEDRLISDKNEIKPANKYIISVEVLNGREDELGYIQELCQNLNIPFYAYDNEKYFDASMKSKAIKVSSEYEKPDVYRGYSGDRIDFAAYLAYKDDTLRKKILNDLGHAGVDVDKYNQAIDEKIDKIKYYLRTDDDYYLNDFANSLSSYVHNARSSTDEITRYLLRQLGLDMKKNGVDTIKEYLRYKVWKGKKSQKMFNEELNTKFNKFIDDGIHYFKDEDIKFNVGENDYDNLLKYEPFRNLVDRFISDLKKYVSDYILNNDDMFRYSYVLSRDYAKDHVKMNKQEISDILYDMDFYDNYITVDEVIRFFNRILNDFESYEYREIKKAQEESQNQFRN